MSRNKLSPLFIANKIQLAIGLMALCLGALVYLTLRSPDQIYFTKYFGIHDRLFEIHSQIWQQIGGRLPAFLHVFSFSLITASFFSYRRKTYRVICSAWFLMDALFELGQKYKIQAARLVPEFFDKVPFLESTRHYFLRGSFDIFDLTASALGAATAYLVLLATSKRAY